MAVKRVDVVVVGGGPAGAAAAAELGRHGAGVLVLDDNLRPGGQYLRGGRDAVARWTDRVRRRGLKVIEGLARPNVEVVSRAEVIGIESGFRLLASGQDGRLVTINAERILLATGARERFMPFPGWTLPGVLSTGAVQALIKQSGVLPASVTLVAGAGLFLTTVSCDIQKNGGRVTAVLNETASFRKVPALALLAGHFAKFALGSIVLASLRLSGIAVRNSTRILEARGGDSLRDVVAARVGPDGVVVPGSEMVYRTDCLAVGFGFTANIELAQLAGCDVAFNSGLGGWVVKVNENLETTVAGISAAGEVTAIGGAAKSLTEGRLAGLSILKEMGLLKSDELYRELSVLKQVRRRQMAFARYFNAQHSFTPQYMAAWIRSLPDDVPVCRCEEVNLGDLRRAVVEGFGTAAGVKKATRGGMGICQGSTCKTILLEALAALSGRPLAHLAPGSVRMPVKPVYLDALAGVGR